MLRSDLIKSAGGVVPEENHPASRSELGSPPNLGGELLSGQYRVLLFYILVVVVFASAVRLYRLNDFPVGAFVDEIFTLNSSLLLSETPFDPFGHTLQISQTWGKDHPNFFLYFNLLVLKVFGVSYLSMKLLSVIPGVITAAFVFLIMERLFDRKVALAAALLFAFGDWPVRLSRYGWDASLMLMTCAAAIWFLVLTMQTQRARYAVCAGIAAGLGLYSYLGARIVLVSLFAFLGLEWALHRDRQSYRDAAGFSFGAVASGLPFLWYYISNPSALWARTSEVSVFNNAHPWTVILTNSARHTLMFHWLGGTFARDNFPGLPMLDPITGALLLGGLIIVGRRADTMANLLGCTFAVNLAGGIFSISQEGAPYVYRTAAEIIPVFLLVGVGLQWLYGKIGTRWLAVLTTLVIILNLYLYFGLEPGNMAAMRVMAYEPRLIGQEIGRDNGPVWLVAPDILTQTELSARPGEKHAAANPAIILQPALRKLAIIDFSGRYDMRQTTAGNLTTPKDMFFVDPQDVPSNGPGKIIFKSSDQAVTQALTRPDVSMRYISDISGEPLFTVASFSAPQGEPDRAKHHLN